MRLRLAKHDAESQDSVASRMASRMPLTTDRSDRLTSTSIEKYLACMHIGTIHVAGGRLESPTMSRHHGSVGLGMDGKEPRVVWHVHFPEVTPAGAGVHRWTGTVTHCNSGVEYHCKGGLSQGPRLGLLGTNCFYAKLQSGNLLSLYYTRTSW